MVPIEPHHAAPAMLDQEAARDAIQRARRLYVSQYRPDEVADVTRVLRGHLQAAIPECERMAAQMPAQSRARDQLVASLQSARHLLTVGVGHGQMSALVHMQLLADSAGVLVARLRAPNGAAGR